MEMFINVSMGVCMFLVVLASLLYIFEQIMSIRSYKQISELEKEYRQKFIRMQAENTLKTDTIIYHLERIIRKQIEIDDQLKKVLRK